MIIGSNRSILWTVGGTLLIIAATAVFASKANAAGIVATIDKAPVIADGNVTGQPADFVITLDGSLDPSVQGRTLKEGHQIKVIMPPEFDLGNLNPAFPLSDLPNPGAPCVPGNLQCTSAVILKGWPQEPYFPPAAFHTHSIDVNENAFIYTAVKDIGGSPGIKQLHLFMHGVPNPHPGMYRIRVEAQTGPNGSWETGSGMYQVIPRSRPSVGITSVLVKALSAGACGPGTLPPNPDNPIYQTTATNTDAPFTWTLLLWGQDNEALDNVALEWTNADHAVMTRNGSAIGHVRIDAPRDASGYGIHQNPVGCPTSTPAAPVVGGTPGIGPQKTGRLDLLFRTGNVAGDYITTISVGNGAPVELTVTAE